MSVFVFLIPKKFLKIDELWHGLTADTSQKLRHFVSHCPVAILNGAL